MTVGDVCAVMDAWAPQQLAYGWDRVGLSVGQPSAPVRKVLVALTVTPEAVAAALRAKAQLIISHHPLIWEPIRALRTDRPEIQLYQDLLKADIACFAAHTNLDVAPGGVSHVLASRLSLEDTVPLFPVEHASRVKVVTFVPSTHEDAVRDGMAKAGAGVIGDYTHCSFSSEGIGTYVPGADADPYAGTRGKLSKEPELRLEMLVPEHALGAVLRAMRSAHPYEEVAYDVYPLRDVDPIIGLGVLGGLAKAQSSRAFAEYVRRALKVKHVRLVAGGNGRIRNVAVMGGSGGGEIVNVPPGIDAFVTGDVRYHDAQAAVARGLTVVDAGHGGTEKWIVPTIAKRLRRCCKGLEVTTYSEPEYFAAITN
jgi:dinuclear metal center YbgI/SA1388 family protein